MKMKSIPIPKKITPCPIKEAVIELRFDSDLMIELILGSLYNLIKDDFPSFPVSLPITNLPRAIREKNQKLNYIPHFEFKNGDYILRLSPRAISICSKDIYKGWSSYFNFSRNVFFKIQNANIVKEPERLGLRYVSFFNNINIFEKIDAEFRIYGNSMIDTKSVLRSEFEIDIFTCILQVTNNALLNSPNSAQEKGSTIDIDMITRNDFKLIDLESIIDNAHTLEKQVFFNLLSDSFLKELQPEY